MDLRGYFQLLLRRWPVILLTAIVGMGISYVSTDRTAKYETSALLLVSPERFSFGSQAANVSFDQISVIDRLLVTYSRMISSDTVASGASDRLQVDRSSASIIGAIRAEIVPATQLLRVVASDTDPTVARDLANAVASSFVESVSATRSANETGLIPGGVPVTIFERARLPAAPLPTRLISNIILGGVFGLLVAAGVCIAADSFDVTVRSVRDTEHKLGVPVVGTIPSMRNPLSLSRTRLGKHKPAPLSNGGPSPGAAPVAPEDDVPRQEPARA